MPVSCYEVIWIFLIYAFFGWCTEVAYAALETGNFVNRGFLNGPVCPIYGCGVLLVVALLTPLKGNLLILFFGSLILTTAIELITGFLLEKIFHNQWWDYSNERFNLRGYICLKFSILWGLACTFVMDMIHPSVYLLIRKVPHIPGVVLLCVLIMALVCDFCITTATIFKFNKRLRLMEEIAGRLKTVSNEIGEGIYGNVTEALEIREELQEKAEEKRKEAKELRRKYEELMAVKEFGHKRLMKAFPAMKSKSCQESLLKLKQHVNEKKEKRK
ncbi:MAG: hypothetical protein HFI76_06395 [Lachnospiraceae bacterium]|nr:hypothetical protein [Lachnospiraceae bacterium]